jgi:hypothetical protein
MFGPTVRENTCKETGLSLVKSQIMYHKITCKKQNIPSEKQGLNNFRIKFIK